ncbi:helix-turn-helix domain-containing protein [Pseudomonas sp. SJZ077]|uniref:helix-turn-helix domain-containing protein n=2 Tax=unclassified Pseudomonas TaxID=196821 RepID=UPI0011A978FF|nr:helix-turn-helix domain-containing protein [Pseudomonas sp. SJZ077]
MWPHPVFLQVAIMSLSEALAAVVRALRQSSNMTQDDLTLIGRSQRNRVERGKANATMETISKIAEMLHVDSALIILLANSLQSGEPADVALQRISTKLDSLKREGALERIIYEPEPRTGRPVARDAQKALERAPLLKQSGMSNSEIAQQLGVSKSTVQRYLTKISG